MKKIKFSLLMVLITVAAQAQDENQNNFDQFKNREFLFDVLHIFATLLGLYLVTSFIVTIVRSGLDSRLKSRMIDRQAPQEMVNQLMQQDKKDSSNTILQWICTLASIGLGLLLVAGFRPFGIHSIAIMAFSIALGLFAYYLFAKRKDAGSDITGPKF